MIRNSKSVLQQENVTFAKCNIYHGFYDSVKTMTQTQTQVAGFLAIEEPVCIFNGAAAL